MDSRLPRFCAVAILWAGALADAGPWPSERDVVRPKTRPFALKDVRLLDGPFRDAMARTQRYLHELESDRLLHMFRKTARLPAPGEPMGGWERTELRGHTMGHYLSACAMMYASTGDEKLKAKADAIVAELARCQKALGGGYLSAFPESFIDRAVACKRVWAPWYTLHKILAGLIDMNVHGRNAQALEVARAFAGWVEARLARLDETAMQRMLDTTEQGGMNEALANLYGLTGEKRWLALSRRFVQRRYVLPLAQGADRLKGQHANSFIPNIVGTARQYELTGRAEDRRIATTFWNQVARTRCYCTGGTSNGEHWRSDPNRLADQLGDHTQETCCTYNMLKLTHHLMAWEPSVELADYYERALLNSILATQDPNTGMMMYFVTLASGRWKYFNRPRDAFWCCTGTGMENHARYGEAIYAHNDDTIWVHQFIASQVHWKDKGARIRQETSFPETPRTRLTIRTDTPSTFEIRVRIPSWVRGRALVFVNDKGFPAKPGRYVRFRKTWHDGERITINTPMGLRVEPMPDDPALAALMFGPCVLAGRLGGKGLTENDVYTSRNWFRFPREKIAPAPCFVADANDPDAWVKPVEGKPLTFRTVGAGRPRDVTLVPYHKLFGERYAVYWRIRTEAQFRAVEAKRKAREAAEAARKKALAQRLVDQVRPGVRESEVAHKLQAKNSGSGVHLQRPWRDARNGGWFSYELGVLPDRPVVLLCTYWGSDAGGRVFDVLVDGTKIATQTLDRNRPDEFFDVACAVPAKLTQGKKKVVVKFAGHPGQTAGGLFALAVLKAKPAE